ncbi:MAG: hypothetical protein K0Q55_2839 [Verrucomicrobia bacterium]|jgi:hypothetical protein|nr:hypothetical protein [Verrucomicrobiota bacterium]
MSNVIVGGALLIAGLILGGVLGALLGRGRGIEEVLTLPTEGELVRALVLSHRLRTNDAAGALLMTEIKIDSCIISLTGWKDAGKLSEQQLKSLSRGLKHRKDIPFDHELYNAGRGHVVRDRLLEILKNDEASEK